jgi:hypothetical protein
MAKKWDLEGGCELLYVRTLFFGISIILGSLEVIRKRCLTRNTIGHDTKGSKCLEQQYY